MMGSVQNLRNSAFTRNKHAEFYFSAKATHTKIAKNERKRNQVNISCCNVDKIRDRKKGNKTDMEANCMWPCKYLGQNTHQPPPATLLPLWHKRKNNFDTDRSSVNVGLGSLCLLLESRLGRLIAACHTMDSRAVNDFMISVQFCDLCFGRGFNNCAHTPGKATSDFLRLLFGSFNF